MSVTISILISLVALIATFYQLYLQRRHNEKSLQPLAQIDLPDHKDHISILIRNNGLGPLLIDRLHFTEGAAVYNSLEDCLTLNTKSYLRVSASTTWPKVVLPNAYLTVFDTQFEASDDEECRDSVRLALSSLTLHVTGRDIYDNKVVLKRDFSWFARYIVA